MKDARGTFLMTGTRHERKLGVVSASPIDRTERPRGIKRRRQGVLNRHLDRAGFGSRLAHSLTRSCCIRS